MTARDETHPYWPVRLPNQYIATDGRGESVAMQRFAGRSYPMVTVKTCHTCLSPYRHQIEIWVLQGRSYNQIVKHLPEDARDGKKPVTANGIMRHKNRAHMPLETVAHREIIEERAKEMGYDIMNAGTSLADYITLGRVVISQVFDKLVDGKEEPDLKDALAFAHLLQRAEAIAGADIDYEIIYRAFVEFQDTVKSLTDQDTYRDIVQTVTSSVVIRQLVQRKEREDEILVESEEGSDFADDAEWEEVNIGELETPFDEISDQPEDN